MVDAQTIREVVSSIDEKYASSVLRLLGEQKQITCASGWASIAYVLAQLIRDNADAEDRMDVAECCCAAIMYMTRELDANQPDKH